MRLSPDGIYVDVIVPEVLARPGKRCARLGPHGKRAARRAKALEAPLVDREKRGIGALNLDDPRVVELWIAGPRHRMEGSLPTEHRWLPRLAMQYFVPCP